MRAVRLCDCAGALRALLPGHGPHLEVHHPVAREGVPLQVPRSAAVRCGGRGALFGHSGSPVSCGGATLPARALPKPPAARVSLRHAGRGCTSGWAGRQDLLDYAIANGIQTTQTKKHSYSEDENIMHISYESGELEDPAFPGNTQEVHTAHPPAAYWRPRHRFASRVAGFAVASASWHGHPSHAHCFTLRCMLRGQRTVPGHGAEEEDP